MEMKLNHYILLCITLVMMSGCGPAEQLPDGQILIRDPVTTKPARDVLTGDYIYRYPSELEEQS